MQNLGIKLTFPVSPTVFIGLACIAIFSTPAGAVPVTGSNNDLSNKAEWKALIEESNLPKNSRIELTLSNTDNKDSFFAGPTCENPILKLPKGSRLWGKTLVQTKCGEQLGWISVEAKVFMPVAVVFSPVKYLDELNDSNVRQEDIEISRYNFGSTWLDAASVIGKQATRPITNGVGIRPEMIRSKPSVNAGDSVKISLKGNGFQIMSEGVALTNAQTGQVVRVKTNQGKVLTGTAKNDLIVEVSL